MKNSRAAYAFLALPMAVLFAFALIPSALGVALAFFQWDGGGEARFVGVENFRALAGDPRFWPALRNTLLFTIGTVPATVALAFVLAAIMHARWFVGRDICRTLFFLPTVVAIVAIGFVWRWMLNDGSGLVPAAIRALGGSPPNFLEEGAWPLVSIIAVSVWRGVGFALVLYLAAMSSLPESLYEAAELDGAGRGAMLRHVTWPGVTPMTVFLCVTGVIGALQVFDIVLVMTTSEVESSATNVLNWYVYREFKGGRLGYAAALGCVVLALSLAATAAQLRLVRRGLR